MTFSIAACDLDAGEWGVAVASKFLAVGAVVPWARAGVGAVATQSYANTTYGPAGLQLLEQGYDAESVMQGLIAADAGRDERQAGIVDAAGRTATFTGSGCHDWAGGRTGPRYAAQGNILTGPEVVDALGDTFERSQGPLGRRLLQALAAGDSAGGDRRGRQSAVLLVVRAGGGYGGFNDRAIDFRVDDHAAPSDELMRLLHLHALYMSPPEDADVVPIDAQRATVVQQILAHSGQRDGPPSGTYDEVTRAAFKELCGIENLEERWREGAEVDRTVLSYLGDKYGVDPQ